MANERLKYLPTLYNPLLNSIFNNNQHAKSAIKNTIHELSLNHNDYTILVPPAYILHNCLDHSSQKLLNLCYNSDDFVRSHIMKTSSAYSTTVAPVTKVQLIIYNTANGKQVLLKNGLVFTGKGFKRSMKLQILGVDYFNSFCDYFPKGSRFLVIYVEDTLFGHQIEGPVATTTAKDNDEKPKKVEPNITFESLLRNFPILSRAMSEKFYVLFHHNNRKFQRLRTKKPMPLEDIKEEFASFVTLAFGIVQNCVNSDTVDGERSYNLLNSIAKQHASLDLNRLIHEYVELNIYDKVWLQLVFQYQNNLLGEAEDGDLAQFVLTPLLYRDLSCLSLNQLDIPVMEPWRLNVLQKRVADAIVVFSKLSNSTISNQREKLSHIVEAVNILTEGIDGSETESDIVIDADTLIGLLIMVVIHSKVLNLEAHLYYVQNFGAHSTTSEETRLDGKLNYIFSNFDAVIYHLSQDKEESHLGDMILASAQNYEFWYAIQKGNVEVLEALLESVETGFSGKQLPKNHFLRSKNINGESCFNFAIRTRNLRIFSMLLHRTEEWISLEDLLFDKNTTTDQTLLMVALHEEAHEITSELIDVILENTTEEESRLYFNLQDINGRTVGHYLAPDLKALDRIGRFIDWKIKDLNSHTPLFSLCRCYDHPDYKKLIAKAFACVFLVAHKLPLSFEDHIDKSGNTLLHVLARAIPESGILTEKALINVNQINNKNLTPVALFIRYSRFENLVTLFEDKRLIFDFEDPKSFYNVMDHYSFSASKTPRGPSQDFVKIQRAVVQKYFSTYFPPHSDINLGLLNARFDGSVGDWIVNTVLFQDEDTSHLFSSKYVPLERLRQFTRIQSMTSPLSFFPSPEAFWVNHPPGKVTVPFFSKFRTNRTLEHLTRYFLSMNFVPVATKARFLLNFARCCRDDSNLILELMKEVSSAQELEKRAFGEVKLTQAKIQEIEYFLEFSQREINDYKMQISKLNKLVSVGGVKQCDLRHVTDRFIQSLPILHDSALRGDLESRRIDAGYNVLQPYIIWVEMCVRELLRNCGRVMDKLKKWRELYGKIKLLNAELHHFEEQVVQHPESTAETTDAAPPDGTPLKRSSTLSINELEDVTEQETSFFNFGLIENKKSRYRKLLLVKSQEVKKLMDLNIEIKLEHEAIAGEISQFLAYRSAHLALGIRNFTSATLVLLRHRHYELTSALADLQRHPSY